MSLYFTFTRLHRHGIERGQKVSPDFKRLHLPLPAGLFVMQISYFLLFVLALIYAFGKQINLDTYHGFYDSLRIATLADIEPLVFVVLACAIPLLLPKLIEYENRLARPLIALSVPLSWLAIIYYDLEGLYTEAPLSLIGAGLLHTLFTHIYLYAKPNVVLYYRYLAGILSDEEIRAINSGRSGSRLSIAFIKKLSKTACHLDDVAIVVMIVLCYYSFIRVAL